MKKKTLHIILFSLLLALLFLPMAQEHLKLFKMKPLGGVTEKVSKPVFTWRDYLSGKLQGQTEKYISRNFGFNEIVIRLYNQYVWSCFRKTYVKTILRGPDDWLYLIKNVEEYYQGLSYSQLGGSDKARIHLKNQAKRIYDIQEELKKDDTYFLFCFTPSKERIVPEHLPKNTSYYKPKDFSARDFLLQQFDSLGVNYIDFCRWFELLKDTCSYPLYAKTGAHWTNISAIYAADSLIRYIEHERDINMHNLIISKPKLGSYKHPDEDLEVMLNLIFPIKKDSILNVVAWSDKDPTAVKPKLINIGDSFFWNFVFRLPMDDIFASHAYWYYNSTIYFDSLHKNTKDVDYVKELTSADIVMLSYSTTQLYKMRGDFPQKAHAAFFDNPRVINYDTMSLTRENLDLLLKKYERELSQPHNLRRMHEKASERNVTLEKAIRDDALWLINKKHNPNKVDIKALLNTNNNDNEDNQTSPSDSKS